MKRFGLAAMLLVVLAGSPGNTAHADGLLPPRPYHYLHPPAALRSVNRRPTAGSRTVPLVHGRSTGSLLLFTSDGQAGLGAHPGTFSARGTEKQVVLRIRPVNVPGGLPAHLTVDGNAYAFEATAEPHNRAVRLRQAIGLVLRWPRPPIAVYLYASHHWKRVCDPHTWQLANGLLVCHASALGTFAAVHMPVPPTRSKRRKP